MKKTSMLAVALAALAIGGAQASTLYIGGASAFRKTFSDALTANGWGIAASDKSDNSGTRVVFTNSTDTICTCWSGSEAGVQSALSGTNNRPLTFFKPDTRGTSLSTNSGNTFSTNADAALTDSSATVSRFNGALNSTEIDPVTGTPVVVNYDSQVGDPIYVGVQSFTWMASPDFPTNTSISANVARVLLKKGSVPLSLITGQSADANKMVWLFGRNPDSGTRITTLCEAGLDSTAQLTQYTNTVKAGGVITEIGLTPAAVINGLPVAEGDNGHSSGGTLAGTIGKLSSSLNIKKAVYGYKTVTTNYSVTNVVPQTNDVVTTNTVDTYLVTTNTVPNVVTYSVWTNVASSNRVNLSTTLFTNGAKVTGNTLTGYKAKNKVAKGTTLLFDTSLVSSNTTTNVVAKGKTNSVNVPAAFSVTEYYYNTNGWSQVTVSQTNGTKSVYSYSPVTVTNLFTNKVVTTVQQTSLVSTNITVIDTTVPVTYTTNAATNSAGNPYDANYAITYCSIADASVTNSIGGEWPVFLKWNNDGIADNIGNIDYGLAKTNLVSRMQYGSYSFYNYENALFNPRSTNPGAKAVFNAVTTLIPSKVAVPNSKLTDMKTKQRTIDGGLIQP